MDTSIVRRILVPATAEADHQIRRPGQLSRVTTDLTISRSYDPSLAHDPIAVATVPALELERQIQTTASHSRPTLEAQTSQIVTGVGDDQFDVDFANVETRFFSLRLRGGSGRVVRLNLKNVNLSKWLTLNPLIASTFDTSDIDAYKSDIGGKLGVPVQAANGVKLEVSPDSKWRFVTDVWVDPGSHSLCVAVKPPTDDVLIAMNYPFPVELWDTFVSETQGGRNPGINVNLLRKTEDGDPIATIECHHGEGTITESRKPIVVLYAREHGDEHESSWVAYGAVRFLMSGCIDANNALDKFDFIIIPVLDPAAARRGVYEGITSQFVDDTNDPDASAYMQYFRAVVSRGRRIAAVIDLHNLESGEGPVVVCPLLGNDARSMILHSAIIGRISSGGFSVPTRPWSRGDVENRLGGWLRLEFGAVHIPYEVNSQAPSLHISLLRLVQVGELIIRGTVDGLNQK